MQKQKEEEIRNLRLRYLQDKVKKAARLRILVVILFVLLAGLIWASVQANKAIMESKVALVKSYINSGEYEGAMKHVNYKNLFSVFYSSYLDTLKVLKDTIEKRAEAKQAFNSSFTKANSLIDEALDSSAKADSILLTDNGLEQERNNLINVIGGEKLIKARNLYDASIEIADSSGIGLIDELIKPQLTTNLRVIEDTTAHFFKQCIDATYALLQANQYETAREAYSKAKNLSSFANTYGIYLNHQDTRYLDSLTKIFNQ
ncbi:MAG: hypothetical protein ICV84_10120 [Flavisolibacter sp.]|nr:hypothetical protein [Flavisolibacter sp.]